MQGASHPADDRLSLCCAAHGWCEAGWAKHVCREKDGLWAVLAWLSVLAYRNKQRGGGPLGNVAKYAPGER